MRNTLWTLLFLILSNSAQAADANAVKKVFKKDFHSEYESSKCQFNTRKFAVRTWEKGIDVRGALFLAITGYGSINYYQGRSGGSTTSQGVWFHHYVLIVPTDNKSHSPFSPDRNYVVIDFDFGNSPQTIGLKQYLENQFMPNSLRGNTEKIKKDFELGLMKLSAYDVDKLLPHIKPDGDISYTMEKEAAEFNEVRFKDFFFRL